MKPEKASRETESPEAQKQQILLFIFCDGQQTYAVDPTAVLEVLGTRETTPVPFTPPWVNGVINTRGEIVPVLDLAAYFGLVPEHQQERKRMILFDVNGHIFSVWSDEIIGVETIYSSQFEKPLGNLPDSLLKCCKIQFRLGDHIVQTLELENLLDQSRQKASSG